MGRGRGPARPQRQPRPPRSTGARPGPATGPARRTGPTGGVGGGGGGGHGTARGEPGLRGGKGNRRTKRNKSMGGRTTGSRARPTRHRGRPRHVRARGVAGVVGHAPGVGAQRARSPLPVGPAAPQAPHQQPRVRVRRVRPLSGAAAAAGRVAVEVAVARPGASRAAPLAHRQRAPASQPRAGQRGGQRGGGRSGGGGGGGGGCAQCGPPDADARVHPHPGRRQRLGRHHLDRRAGGTERQ